MFTWQQAREFCQSMNGDLIQVQDQAEHDLLTSIIKLDGATYWVKLTFPFKLSQFNNFRYFFR